MLGYSLGVLAACLAAAPAAPATDEGRRQDLVEILEGLEHGLAALERLGRPDALDRLRGVADEVRRELEGGARHGAARRLEAEIEQARAALGQVQRRIRRLERDSDVTRAVLARVEEDRGRVEPAEFERLRQRYLRRLEVNEHLLHGFRQCQARLEEALEQVRAKAPEALGSDDAERRVREAAGRLERLDALAARLEAAAGRRRRPADAPGGPGGPEDEREIIAAQIEALRLALPALRQEGHAEAVERIEGAIGARELALEGRRDEEALALRRRAPRRDETVELLVRAEQIYHEYGAGDKARRLGRLSERLWPPRRRAGGARHGLAASGELIERLERLERRLEALERAVGEIRGERRR